MCGRCAKWTIECWSRKFHSVFEITFHQCNPGFVENISDGFPGLSRPFCGVFSMTFQDLVQCVNVLVLLTRSTLHSQHIVTVHCTNCHFASNVTTKYWCISVLFSACITTAASFLAISQLLGQVLKIISPLNSVSFSTSDSMGELNLWNPFFSDLRCHFSLFTSGGWPPRKAQLRSIIPVACRKSFPVSCAQDTGNSTVFGSGTAKIRNFGNVYNTRVRYPDSYNLVWFIYFFNDTFSTNRLYRAILLPSSLLLWLCKVPLHRLRDSVT